MACFKKESIINRLCYDAAMREKWLLSAVIIAVFVFAAPFAGFAMGLQVRPGDIYIENVPLGERVAVSAASRERVKLSINNTGTSVRTYTIHILPTAQTTAVLKQGYKDIPDTSWISPEPKEVQVSGNSTKAVELYIKIPQNPQYQNKQYQAVIEVKSKKTSPNEIFVLACQTQIFFSTVSPDIQEAKNEDE